MATGGRVGFELVAWFNGGLFADDAVLPLEKAEIDTVLQAATLEWSEIDPLPRFKRTPRQGPHSSKRLHSLGII